jgi:hypothetical protein
MQDKSERSTERTLEHTIETSDVHSSTQAVARDELSCVSLSLGLLTSRKGEVS